MLIIDALDVSFGEQFWTFIEDGGYRQRQKSTGDEQFYRFTNPSHPDFPFMIELFSRKPNNFNLKFKNGLTPIHIEESIASLSAIILDDSYYELLLKSQTTIDGYSVMDIETVILFKIKALIDHKERKDAGFNVDSKNIKKHKNDIFRLLANVLPTSKVKIGTEIKDDIRKFINLIKIDKPILKDLGIKDSSLDEMIDLITRIYL